MVQMTHNVFIIHVATLHLNYTVVQYQENVVVIAVTWESFREEAVYNIRVIPVGTGDTVTQELSSLPAHLSLPYNTEYSLAVTVQEAECSESVSRRFFQGSSVVSKIVP